MDNAEEKSPANKATNKIVQTYAEDMAEVLTDGKDGIVKKIIHGEEAQEQQKRNESPETKKNKVFMFVGALLFLVSIGMVGFFLVKRTVPSIPVTKQFIPLIFTEKNALVELGDLKKDQIGDKVRTEVDSADIKIGGIEGIYPTLNNAPVGLRKFTSLIEGAFVPDDTNFIEDNFLMGVYNEDLPPTVSQNTDTTASTTPTDVSTQTATDTPAPTNRKDFFMILRARSTPDIFGAMSAWEPKMFNDLHTYFGIPLSPDTKYLLTKGFQDGIVENKNARILGDNQNNIVLMYVFADDNDVIITNTSDATREIIARLASSQVKK